MTPEFLRDVQRHGYMIEAVTEDACIARCPSNGCGVRLNLREGQTVPPRSPQESRPEDRPVSSFDEGRMILRDRREELLLTIDETEGISGVASSQLAKCERDQVTRPVGVDGFIHWAGALGFEVVLRPIELPPLTVRILANTRGKLVPRQQSVARRRAD